MWIIKTQNAKNMQNCVLSIFNSSLSKVKFRDNDKLKQTYIPVK